MIVVDASVVLAWCFGDEESLMADRTLETLRVEPAVVPSIWPFEVANALLAAERHDRIAVTERPALLDLLAALPIEIEPVTLAQTLERVTDLARQHGLSVYDAAYVEIAERMGLPLATLDARVRSAADALGIASVA